MLWWMWIVAPAAISCLTTWLACRRRREEAKAFSDAAGQLPEWWTEFCRRAAKAKDARLSAKEFAERMQVRG